MERVLKRHTRLLGLVILAVAGSALLSACSAGENDPDRIAGKQLFVQKCGACHMLARAGTKGTQGPNLDEAFQQARQEGFGETAIQGAVYKQILHPSVGTRACEPDCVRMPAKLVTGDSAHDVAAYVAMVAAAGGKDEGLLATAVKAAGDGKPVAAKDGVLSIAADPTGQLAFVTKLATAPVGSLTVRSPNKSSVLHDIVIDGKGNGQEVKDGGVSEFKANFTAGKYDYYCSIPGHRQAGMEGTLTVK
ncbi:MAG TPA: plastocyanin/azurin family copper-binding protein [Baekduia sp.]|nr:plastocyanin/azurin family copper-binding protein [Baekduia sp.]